MRNESAWKGADDFQILLYNAKNPGAVEHAIEGAIDTAADLFHKTPSQAMGSGLQADVNFEAVKILNDTIARLQDIVKMAEKEKTILWRLQKGEQRG